MPSTNSYVLCPACGETQLPLDRRGEKLVARHNCLGLPWREVYETDAVEGVEDVPANGPAPVERAKAQKGDVT